VLGAIEARHGDWRRPLAEARARNGNGAVKSNGHVNGNGKAACEDPRMSEPLHDCCADGILEAGLPRVASPKDAEPRDFEEFIYRVWGAGIAKHFAIPYNRKLWTVPLTQMETSWLAGRVPFPDL